MREGGRKEGRKEGRNGGREEGREGGREGAGAPLTTNRAGGEPDVAGSPRRRDAQLPAAAARGARSVV